VLLRQVELALLLKTRASAGVVLTQSLELGTVFGELLCEAALRRNGAGPTSRLLVLRAGRRERRRVGNLTPLECLVEAVKLRKANDDKWILSYLPSLQSHVQKVIT
jgi:hypothetical protein